MQSQFVLTVLVLLGSFVSGQKNAEVKIVLTYFNSAEDRPKEIYNMDYRLENTWTERPSSYVVDLTDQDLASEQSLTEWANTNVSAFYFIFHMIEKFNLEEDMRPFITAIIITGCVSMVLAIINFEVAKSRREKDAMKKSEKGAAASFSNLVTIVLNIIIFLLVVAATVCFMIVQSSGLILTFWQAFCLAFPVIALVVVVLTLCKQYQKPKKEV